MSLFSDRFFTIYNTEDYNYDYEFYVLSQIATIVGSFICTMGTAVICDMYDNYNYMTKAYICIYTNDYSKEAVYTSAFQLQTRKLST